MLLSHWCVAIDPTLNTEISVATEISLYITVQMWRVCVCAALWTTQSALWGTEASRSVFGFF